MRILYVTNHRRFKIHFRAYPWARELAALGHEVDVFCHANTARWRTQIEHVDGFRIVHNPDLLFGALRQGWDPYCAVRRTRWLFRENRPYDLIHCLDTRLAVIWPALAYARARQIPIVSDWIDWWGRGGLIKERRPGWYRLMFTGVETYFEEHYRSRLDGLSAISHALIERAVKLGVPRERCHWIPGGANVSAFASALSADESRKQLRIPQDAPVVCFSGLDVLIDLPLAIHTFEKLKESLADVVLLLVGPREGDVLPHLRNPANRSSVIATGPVPYQDLGRYLPAADVFLMPYKNKVSNVGRWPNKVGDYMCIGRPIVSNPVGEVKLLFDRYDLGALAEESEEDMASKTLSLLHDQTRARVLGERCRELAAGEFSWPRLVGGLEQWYLGILSRA